MHAHAHRKCTFWVFGHFLSHTTCYAHSWSPIIAKQVEPCHKTSSNSHVTKMSIRLIISTILWVKVWKFRSNNLPYSTTFEPRKIPPDIYYIRRTEESSGFWGPWRLGWIWHHVFELAFKFHIWCLIISTNSLFTLIKNAAMKRLRLYQGTEFWQPSCSVMT